MSRYSPGTVGDLRLKRARNRIVFLLVGLWLLLHAAALALGVTNAFIALLIYDAVFVSGGGLWWLSGKVFRQ